MSQCEVVHTEFENAQQLNTENTQITLQRFWECMYAPGDIVEFRLIKPGPKDKKPQSKQHWATTLSDMPLADFHASNQLGFNVYAGINPRTNHGGAKADDVAQCRVLAVDLDGVTFNEWTFKAHSWNLPGPTMIIRSGGGLWIVWRLEEPLEPARWTQYQRALIQECRDYELNADKTIHDPPRVMRVPGYINHEYDHKPIATILSADPCRKYSLDEFPLDVNPLPTIKKANVIDFTSEPCRADDVEGDSPKPTDPGSASY